MQHATIPIFGSRRSDARLVLPSLGLAFLSACTMRHVEHRPSVREGAPYSRAVWVGNTLYLAGDGAPHDDPVEEAHQLMRSVRATLESEGLTLDDLVQVTVFCSDVSLYDTFNTVYTSYFSDRSRLPARAFVGSGKLLWGMRFELQGIAVRR